MPAWLKLLALGVGAPALAAFAIAVAAAPWRKADTQKSHVLRATVGLVAVFVAYLVGHLAFVGVPQLWPVDISQWLLHMVVVALACGVGLAWLRDHTAWAWLLRAVASLAVVWLIVRPLLSHRFTDVGAVVVAAGSISLLGFVSATEQAVSRATPRVGATLLLALVSASAAATVASGTLLVAQLGGAAASGLFALWLVQLRYASKDNVTALAPMIAVIAASTAAVGHVYAAMPLRVLTMLAAVPVVFWVVSLAASRSPWRPRASALALIAALLMATAAVAAAVAPAQADDASTRYE